MGARNVNGRYRDQSKDVLDCLEGVRDVQYKGKDRSRTRRGGSRSTEGVRTQCWPRFGQR